MEQIKGATGNIVDFSKSFVVAVWRKHFGEEIVADETTAVENAPGIDKFSLPFFFAIPGEEPIAKDAVFTVRPRPLGEVTPVAQIDGQNAGQNVVSPPTATPP